MKISADVECTRTMTEHFLKNAKKFDFGKKWMEEIDTIL